MLSKTSLKSRIIAELSGLGFVTSGTHAKSEELAEAIANAVVDEITTNAVVAGNTTSGAPDSEHALTGTIS